jgi:hypothetical protein
MWKVWVIAAGCSLSPICLPTFCVHDTLASICVAASYCVYYNSSVQSRSVFTCLPNHTPYTLKAKAAPLHAAKALGGRGDIAPTHSRPRTAWGEWSASCSRPSSPGKYPPVPIVQETVWAPEKVWTHMLHYFIIFSEVGHRCQNIVSKMFPLESNNLQARYIFLYVSNCKRWTFL